jgi:uncharacterized Zn-finger protein
MVQELQHQSVPEEFFNLTQLAEVTLIAGKLSTTDINEIRNYISKAEDCHTVNGSENDSGNSHRILSHYNEKSNINYESAKKKWKTHWENLKDREATHFANVNYKANENSPSSVSPKTYAFLSSSCSSVSSDCDDDSTKSLLSYSHKVFDRKKQRSFKQSSTESEYEFHFECQRPPYNGGALQFKDASCDITKSSNEHPKSDIDINDMDEIKYEVSAEKCANDNLCGGNGEIKSASDEQNHMCPECGKKYSTSMRV